MYKQLSIKPWISVILGKDIIILAVKSYLESVSYEILNFMWTCLFIDIPSLRSQVPFEFLLIESSLSSYSILSMVPGIEHAEGI